MPCSGSSLPSITPPSIERPISKTTYALQRLLVAFDHATGRDRHECLEALRGLFQAAHKRGIAAAAPAEEVYAERNTSDTFAVDVAEYLARGLNRPQRAIGLLLDAQRRKALGRGGQRALVQLLENADRPADAIPTRRYPTTTDCWRWPTPA
jgi:hypothetical protein